jgi:hypothetical protein
MPTVRDTQLSSDSLYFQCQLLGLVRLAEHSDQQYFITINELWFDLTANYEIISLLDGEQPLKEKAI